MPPPPPLTRPAGLAARPAGQGHGRLASNAPLGLPARGAVVGHAGEPAERDLSSLLLPLLSPWTSLPRGRQGSTWRCGASSLMTSCLTQMTSLAQARSLRSTSLPAPPASCTPSPRAGPAQQQPSAVCGQRRGGRPGVRRLVLLRHVDVSAGRAGPASSSSPPLSRCALSSPHPHPLPPSPLLASATVCLERLCERPAVACEWPPPPLANRRQITSAGGERRGDEAAPRSQDGSRRAGVEGVQ